jgi:plastocyanin
MAEVIAAPDTVPNAGWGKKAPWAVLVVLFEVMAIAGPVKMLTRGSGDGGGSGTGDQVNMAGLTFAPGELVVDRGTSVRFVNDDVAPHTITATDGSGVDSGTLNPGDEFTLTINQNFAYFCAIHPSMTASVVVG